MSTYGTWISSGLTEMEAAAASEATALNATLVVGNTESSEFITKVAPFAPLDTGANPTTELQELSPGIPAQSLLTNNSLWSVPAISCDPIFRTVAPIFEIFTLNSTIFPLSSNPKSRESGSTTIFSAFGPGEPCWVVKLAVYVVPA